MLHAKLLRNCFLRNPTQVLAETLEAGSVLCQQEFQDAVVQRGRAQVWWGTFPPSPGPRDDHLNDERREHFCTGSSRWTSILLQPCTFGFPSVNQLGDLCIEEGSGEVCRETMQALLDPERRQHPRPRIIPHETDRLGTTATPVGSSLPSGEG